MEVKRQVPRLLRGYKTKTKKEAAKILSVIYRPMKGNPRQSWILDSTPRIPDFRCWTLSMQVFVSGTCTLESNRWWILVSFGCVPDDMAQDSGFHKQKFPRFRIPLILDCL